jgi:hypothetical protein
MEPVGKVRDALFIFGCMKLDGPFVIAVKEIFEAAHDIPAGGNFLLGVSDRKMFPTQLVIEHDVPHLALQRYHKMAVPTVSVSGCYFGWAIWVTGPDSPTVGSTEFF